MHRVWLLVSVGLLGLAACAPCANTVAEELAAPGGAYRAVVFARDCGATTGSNTQVSVLGSDERLDGAGNALVIDSDHGAVPAGPMGGPAVAVRWLAPDHLELRDHSRARVFQAAERVAGRRVTHVRDST